MPTAEVIIIVFLAIFAIIAAVIIVFALIELYKGRKTERMEMAKFEEIRKNPIILNLDITSDSPVSINGRAISATGGKAVILVEGEDSPEGGEFEKMTREGKSYYRSVEAAIQAKTELTIRNKDYHLLALRDGMTAIDLSVNRGWGRVFLFIAGKNPDSGRYERINLNTSESVARAIELIKKL